MFTTYFKLFAFFSTSGIDIKVRNFVNYETTQKMFAFISSKVNNNFIRQLKWAAP